MRWWQISKRDQDLEREIRSDLELEEQEQRDRGLPDHEARFAAQHALGNAALIRDRTHETWGWTPFEHLWPDVHFGIRSLLKSRQFTIAAALTLALGIGTSTAMFSAILRPAKALAISGSRSFGFRIAAPARWQWQSFSSQDFLDWKEQGRLLARIGAHVSWQFNLSSPGSPPERISGDEVLEADGYNCSEALHHSSDR